MNELNCHLHPLDSIAKETRAALKTCEQNIVGKVWGRDFIAGNIVLAMNKLRFKMEKGILLDLQHFYTKNNYHVHWDHSSVQGKTV